jgi:quercetin dioxygenase-like cupin family protein
MIDFQVEHFFSDGVYSRKMTIPKGVTVPTHKHKFNHMSIVASGKVQVTVDGETKKYIGPAQIEIKKDQVHTVYALEETVWFCIHATDVVDVDEIDHELISGEENAI